jgi:2-oxo-4-hydroxy-4-carboxy-5-ureidoimidazoline decarboxylase
MRFDELPEQQARELLLRCLSAPGWAELVLSGRPYVVKDRLLAAADVAARELAPDDLESALGGHPRIGEEAGAAHHAAASAEEQSGVDARDVETAQQLAEGNRAYEARFGHVFLIKAAGRTGPEILGELQRRLANPAEVEREETLDNLRRIALARLDQEV